MINFHIISILPEIFPGPLGVSLAGKAKGKLWDLHTYNPRDYASDPHKTIDDKPFGGGEGMVMKPDIAGKVIDDIKSRHNLQKMIYFSPRGRSIDQNYVMELSKHQDILLLCGRFEGVDQRIIDFYNFEEVSCGDFIMSGGEIPALMLIDACIRLIPGVISNQNALDEESFVSQNQFSGLLEYPLYTRPFVWNNLKVPEILLSGHHKKISEWRLQESKTITMQRRPDLWEKYCKLKNT